MARRRGPRRALPRAHAAGALTGSALTPLEIASGLPFGVTGASAVLPQGETDPRAALERAMLPALRRAPCLVSFSGGRDSSAVLAVAAALAAREGLPAPVPATNRFSAAPAAEESAWQEQVVRHLGLDEWLRLEHDDELDLLGPVATRVLRRHGLLWPFNAHFHVPLLQAARGGSLLTGIGGDELCAAATRAPAPRGALRRGYRRAPAAVRRAVHARRHPVPMTWLTPGARRAASRAAAAEEITMPRTLRERLAWFRSLRYLAVGGAALERLAADDDVLLAHPLLHRDAWGAVAVTAPAGGFAGRTSAMRALFADLLPDALLARSGKAGFDEAFFRAPSHAFVAAWDGSGLPADLVDAAALRAEWSGDNPAAQSFTALQAAWLASEAGSARGGEEPLAGVVE